MKAEILPALRGMWSFGIACWLFGITDRTIAATGDGTLSAIDLMQLFTAAFIAVVWGFFAIALWGED